MMNVQSHLSAAILLIIGIVVSTGYAKPTQDSRLNDVRTNARDAFEELEHALTHPESARVDSGFNDKEVETTNPSTASGEIVKTPLDGSPQIDSEGSPSSRNNSSNAVRREFDKQGDVELDSVSGNQQMAASGKKEQLAHGVPAPMVFLDLMPIEERINSAASPKVIGSTSRAVTTAHPGSFVESVARHFVSEAIGAIFAGPTLSWDETSRDRLGRSRSSQRAQRAKRRAKRRQIERRRRLKRRNRQSRRNWL